jgi:2'-5' RNA ligase
VNGFSDHRLWIAVEPAIPIVDRLLLLQEELEEPLHHLGIPVRWSPGEALRLYLHSAPCGDVSREALVRDAVSAIARSVAPFEWTTEGTEFEPSLEVPRTVSTGTSHGATELQRLAQRLEAAFQSVGFRPDPRPFAANIHIGRVRSSVSAPDVRGVIDAYRATVYGTTFCRELVLLSSSVHGTEVRWVTRARVELGTGR